MRTQQIPTQSRGFWSSKPPTPAPQPPGFFQRTASKTSSVVGIKPRSGIRMGGTVVALAVLGGGIDILRRSFAHAQFFKESSYSDKHVVAHLGKGIGRTFQNMKDGLSATMEKWFPGKGLVETTTDGRGNKSTKTTRNIHV
jgi:hypothetical protein